MKLLASWAFRHWPLHNGLYFSWVHRDSFAGNDMTQIVNLFLEEGTLQQLPLQFVLSKAGQHYSQVFLMFSFVLGIDEDVI
jgi:hypothetical protein